VAKARGARWAGDAAGASLSPGAQGTRVRVFGLGVALMAMALSGCAVAVVTGGAIVADEVIEQVEGGGDGLF
jgi:hypothetical protein